MIGTALISARDFTSVRVDLAPNQVWSSKYTVERSCQYSYVFAALKSVYPTSGTDNFTKIQARLVSNSGISITDNNSGYVVLKEGAGDQQIFVKNGYLNVPTVYIQFRGNTDARAIALVEYFGN